MVLFARAATLLGALSVLLPCGAVAFWFFATRASPAPDVLLTLLWAAPAGQILVWALSRIRARHAQELPARPGPRPLLLLALTAVLVAVVARAWMLCLTFSGVGHDPVATGTRLTLLMPLYLLVGAAIGAFGAGRLAERVGGRTVLLLSGLGCETTSMGGVLNSPSALVAAVFFSGVSAGALITVVFVLLSRSVPAKRRALVSALLAGVALAGGHLLAVAMDNTLVPGYGWRALWLAGVVPGAVVLAASALVYPGRLGERRLRPPRLTRGPLVIGGAIAGATYAGILGWSPTLAVQSGFDVGIANGVLTAHAWLIVPVAIAVLLRRGLPTSLGRIFATAGGLVLLYMVTSILPTPDFVRAGILLLTLVAAATAVVSVVAVAGRWSDAIGGPPGLGVIIGAVLFGGLAGIGACAAVQASAIGLLAAVGALGMIAIVWGSAVLPAVPQGAVTAARELPYDRDDEEKPRIRVAIVGSGFGGLCAAIRLKQEGVDDFVLLERAGDIGGTWRDNTYPGAACDVPSTLYSFSFAPNPDWTRSYSPQAEIHRYLKDCVTRYGLEPHLRLGHEVHSAAWDETASCWRIETAAGQVEADVLVSGTGPLSDPLIPDLPGLGDFAGPMFHSARWDHSFDPDGKRIAVIGTGASAAQFLPAIQPVAGELAVFQRTAPWVFPSWNRRRTKLERRIFRLLPGVQSLLRALVYWGRESYMVAMTGQRNSWLLKPAVWMARSHLRRQVTDPALRETLTPAYTVGCKRPIVSSLFYRSLTQPNVELVTDGIREVRASSIITADGTERPVDAIVLATGFRPANLAIAGRVYGRGNKSLAERWAGGAHAYRGTTVTGFPNLFLLAGPNSFLGHNSAILAIEAQVEYVLDALRVMRSRELASVEVHEDLLEADVQHVHSRMQGTVWLSGCQGWYVDERGRNTTLWPGFTAQLRRRFRRFDVGSYQTRYRSIPDPVVAETDAAREPERLG